jgi:hypothetical protein
MGERARRIGAADDVRDNYRVTRHGHVDRLRDSSLNRFEERSVR